MRIQQEVVTDGVINTLQKKYVGSFVCVVVLYECVSQSLAIFSKKVRAKPRVSVPFRKYKNM